MNPLLALKGDQVVGRIVGVIDEVHCEFTGEKTAFYGFYESIDDQEVADALFKEIKKWAKEWGMTGLRGPVNPSTNHECGLLVEGFNDPPNVMMTYNPPYYSKLFENAGFLKSKDLHAYDVTNQSKFSERLLARAERIKVSSKITFREISMKKFREEVQLIRKIYNDAWEKNWGFVPMNEEEFDHMAKDMKMIVDPRLVLIAEVAGEPAGFSLALPDVNQAIGKIQDGKLLPTGIFKLLWYLKGPSRKKTINRCRILTLGIMKKYQPLGIGPLLYAEYFKRGPALGYPVGEASWILEDNVPMVKALQMMDAKRTKVYRIYDQAL